MLYEQDNLCLLGYDNKNHLNKGNSVNVYKVLIIHSWKDNTPPPLNEIYLTTYTVLLQ